jgi:hypothetical protein
VTGDTGRPAPTAADERDDVVRLVRFAGLLTGSLFSIPGGLVLEPQPALYKHLLALTGALFAAAFLFAPAARITGAWIYGALGIGTVLIGIAVASSATTTRSSTSSPRPTRHSPCPTGASWPSTWRC